jgi:hypothetical protein
MKQLLFLLSLGLLLANPAQAQWGVRTGGNATLFTKAKGEDATTSRQLGYQVGLFYQVPLTKHLSLVPEVQFSRERFRTEKTVADPLLPSPATPGPYPPVYYDYIRGFTDYRYTQSLSYLNLPVVLRATVGACYLEAGPQLSLLLGGRAQGTGSYAGGGVYGTGPLDVADAPTLYRRLDVGPTVGVGVRLPAGLGVGLRGYWGLTKSSKEETATQAYATFQRRQTLQASLTYQLATR